jgi:hypothetical protein
MEYQKVNNPRGLVYIGRSFSYAQKVEPVHKTEPVGDQSFTYYYNLYIRKEDKNMRADFKEAMADQVIRMDAVSEEDKRIPRLARLQKRVLGIDQAIENVRLLLNDMPENSSAGASAIRILDALRNKAMIEVDKASRNESAEEAKRTFPVKCETCGQDNYFSKREYWSHEQKRCTHCGLPL